MQVADVPHQFGTKRITQGSMPGDELVEGRFMAAFDKNRERRGLNLRVQMRQRLRDRRVGGVIPLLGEDSQCGR